MPNTYTDMHDLPPPLKVILKRACFYELPMTCVSIVRVEPTDWNKLQEYEQQKPSRAGESTTFPASIHKNLVPIFQDFY